MSAKRTAIFNQGRGKQHGAVLMIMLVIMIVGIAAILVNSLSSATLKNARQKNTADALAQAKDALLGRAVSDSNMPGSLPCPDTNDDGSAELLSGNNCPSYIGRLPWKTLGLPDLRDGSGERLWYALSPAFRDDNSAQPLNSNTKGTLLVYNTDGVSLQTQAGYNAVAVIFSPGSALGSQTRNTVAQQNSAANYLDIANGQNNSSASGPFIAGTQSATFNDQFLYITTKDLIPLVEQRVAGEVKRALTDYYTANGYYPWADTVAQSADYDSNDGLNRGWLPDSAAISGSYPTPNWAAGSPPQWFFDNQWYSLIYYSVAKSYTKNPLSCYSCNSSTLSVDGVSGVRALFFMPGTPIGTLVRSVTTLPDYLEDSQNNDDANDLYVTPTSQAQDRDRLYQFSSIWTP
jgi:type II secretory pathway pseudopilin PulG